MAAITIQVQSLLNSGGTLTINTNTANTVQSVIDQVVAQESLPANIVALTLDGVTLDPAATLAAEGVTNQAKLGSYNTISVFQPQQDRRDLKLFWHKPSEDQLARRVFDCSTHTYHLGAHQQVQAAKVILGNCPTWLRPATWWVFFLSLIKSILIGQTSAPQTSKFVCIVLKTPWIFRTSTTCPRHWQCCPAAATALWTQCPQWVQTTFIESACLMASTNCSRMWRW